MMMEWIAPVAQHGKQFVYMPTWDARRITGNPNEVLSEKRTAEFARVYGTTGPVNGYLTDPVTGTRTNFNVGGPTQFYDDRIGVPAAVYFKTDTPSQA